MVNKADAQTSTHCIFLSEAIDLVGRAYGSAQLAERLLKKWLGEERVRWRCQLLDGDGARWNLPMSEPNRSGKFWRYVQDKDIHGSENWASIKYLVGCTIGMIAVVKKDVLVLLPSDHAAPVPVPTEAAKPTVDDSPKAWITDQFKRMEEAGELPAGITDCSRELYERMQNAHKKNPNLRLLALRSIENGLREWGLWPPGSTK
jgi:hypothetical protein